MKHIVSKLFLGFLCMAFITVGLLWLIQVTFLKDSYLNQRVTTINQGLGNASVSDAINYQELESSLNISVLSVDSSGSVIYTSQGLPMHGLITRQIQDLLKRNDGEIQFLENESQQARYALVGQKLSDGGHIFAVFSMVDVNEASQLLLQQLWIITTVLLVAALLLAVILSRMFSKPIVRVTHAARDLAQGQYNIELPVGTKDEIGQLTTALNELGVELSKTEVLRRELIANVSHELRSPLAIIQGFAETVRDVTWPDETKRTAQLTMISEEASRLSRVVADILDYSRLQSGVDKISISDFAGYPVLEEIIGRYQIEAGKKGVTLELICPYIMLRFDQGKLVQVLNNLLNNAINHATTGSKIYVRCEQSGDDIKISVENSGQPIPAEETDKIWDRYYRVSQPDNLKRLGTGLGLSIVKSILTQHNVPFGVSSDEKRTIFWFMTIPVIRA